MRSPARVLVASTSYPANAEDPSGHFVRTEARALALSGAEVHVLAPCPMAEDDLSIAAFPLGGRALFSWPGALARASENPLRLAALGEVGAAAARFFARAPRFDRAVLHFLVPVAFPCAELLRGCEDIEAVAHGADVRLLLRAPPPLRRYVVRRLLGRARIRFVAHHLLEQLCAALDDETRVRLERAAIVRPAAIDVTSSARRSDKVKDLPHEYAVWVGRDVANKRLDVALSAARAVGLHLVVIGAERRGARELRGATFLGTLPRSDALAWIAEARVLVSTSLAEGAPTVVREARALGVPVVACNAGDVARWASEDAGISISARDTQSVARAIRSVLG